MEVFKGLNKFITETNGVYKLAKRLIRDFHELGLSQVSLNMGAPL